MIELGPHGAQFCTQKIKIAHHLCMNVQFSHVHEFGVGKKCALYCKKNLQFVRSEYILTVTITVNKSECLMYFNDIVLNNLNQVCFILNILLLSKQKYRNFTLSLHCLKIKLHTNILFSNVLLVLIVVKAGM